MEGRDDSARRSDDVVQPFLVVGADVRGRMVRLGAVVDEVLGRHDYPEPVAVMLGEALALAGTLAATIKYEGVFTLQTKGDGPIALIVADVTHEGAMRGYAQFDQQKLDDVLETGGAPVGDSVPRLLGEGYLAFTVDQGPETERYQGIVRLEGARLSDCVEHYFEQSEQISASLKVAAGRILRPGQVSNWRAAGLMVQRLPEDEARPVDPDGWNRARTLMESASADELLDPELTPDDLLFRLFHEDGVRVFEPVPMAARCRCSRDRVENVLRAISPEELDDLKVDGRVFVKCEFCGRQYDFDENDLAALRT